MAAIIHSGPIWESGKKYNKGQNLYFIYYSENPLEKQNCKDQSSVSKSILTFGVEIKQEHFKIPRKWELNLILHQWK